MGGTWVRWLGSSVGLGVGMVLGAVDAQGVVFPNVLLIVADDMGLGEVGAYGVGEDVPPTPNLDLLAAKGVRFTNAWASPVCSPTRAQLQTGRLGFRTGVGSVIHQGEPGLPASEVVLPEMLDRSIGSYVHAAIGKWHLGDRPGEGPIDAGYDFYAGLNGSTTLTEHYYAWTAEVNGLPISGTEYLTTQEALDAGDWIDAVTEPWFVQVAFHAPHDPLQPPPAHLHSQGALPIGPTTKEDRRLVYKAMVEAMDAEIGNLLTRLGSRLARTVVVFAADNGTIVKWNAAPYGPFQGKATMFQGGIEVPLIVAGPGIAAGATSDALVHLVDLFPTIAELARVELAVDFPGLELDGRSLVPLLANPALPGLRDLVHSEYFGPNGQGVPLAFARRAVRDSRYKLLRTDAVERFFDLRLDPFEKSDLLGGPLSAAQLQAYQLLSLAIDHPGQADPYLPALPGPFVP